MGIGDRKETKHPAYGLLQINRINGHANLVGSEVTHQNFYELRVKEAVRIDGDGEISYMSGGGRCLVIAQLSPNQFVDLITASNIGEGIPCTIRYVHGDTEHVRPKAPRDSSRIQLAGDWAKEYGQTRREIADREIQEIEGLISGLSAKKQTEIMKLVKSISQYFDNNSKFFRDRITEATEKSVQIAKTEIEAYVASTVRALGLSSLKALDVAAKEDLNTQNSLTHSE